MRSSWDSDNIGLAGKPLTELPEPEHRICRTLHALWLAKKGDRDMPARADISPADMKSILPNVYMIDILEGGADYHVRLFGTALVELIGQDPTGHRVSEAAPELAWRAHVYHQVFERQAPTFYRFDLGEMGRPHIYTENVLLPMRDSKGEFSILLCASVVVSTSEPPPEPA